MLQGEGVYNAVVCIVFGPRNTASTGGDLVIIRVVDGHGKRECLICVDTAIFTCGSGYIHDRSFLFSYIGFIIFRRYCAGLGGRFRAYRFRGF